MRDRQSSPAAAGAIVLLLMAAAAPDVRAQAAENVAVVVNESSEVSRRIGEHYVRTRDIPSANVVRIRASLEETIDRAAFDATIAQPVAEAIARNGLQDRIHYLVLVKGVPLRISGTAGATGTAASVDSELTLLYRRMIGQVPPVRGWIDNPYFSKSGPGTEVRPFTHREHDIYLVTRLDGFTEADVMALIDRGRSPAREGRVVLDQRDPLVHRRQDEWLASAARLLEGQGHGERVLLERTLAPARTADPVLGYYSWGSLDPQNRARRLGLPFAPGAIAAGLQMSDARTFRAPDEEWQPTGQSQAAYAGSPHGLVGDLVREGVTGAAAQVAEAYEQGVVRPDVLFPAYLAGANLAEAFYAALPTLGWQAVIVGDPLCAPFRTAAAARAELEEPVDAATGLPGLFARRRLAQLSSQLPGVPEAALTQAVRGEALQARGDAAGARAALERASALAPRVALWQMQLATLDEQAEDYEAAMSRYRAVLQTDPNHAAALNNLAYALAVRRAAPAEALPFAKRAAAAAPGQPMVLDTLGWVEYLLGNHAEAAKLLAVAARGLPGNAEVRLHAAFGLEAAGVRAAAATELKAALALDPALEARADVRQLRARIDERAAK